MQLIGPCGRVEQMMTFADLGQEVGPHFGLELHEPGASVALGGVSGCGPIADLGDRELPISPDALDRILWPDVEDEVVIWFRQVSGEVQHVVSAPAV